MEGDRFNKALKTRLGKLLPFSSCSRPDTALRLARYFGTTPELWLNLQQAHDLSVAQIENGARIADVVRPRAA